MRCVSGVFQKTACQGSKKEVGLLQLILIKQSLHEELSHGIKINEADEILKKLEDKHSGNYDDTRLRAWAHMVHIGTHKPLDDPTG